MKFGMVSPLDTGPYSNPGCHMITMGIRHLLRQAFPTAEFLRISMWDWSPESEATAAQCDALILCGNPRYDTGDHSWLYAGIMSAMLATGKPCIDAWAGSSCHIGADMVDDAATLVACSRNQEILRLLSKFKAVITRDARAQRVNEIYGIPSLQLPCSSWWATAEAGVTPQQIDPLRLFVVYRQKNKWCQNLVQDYAADGWLMIATNKPDLDWCQSLDATPAYCYQPRALLSLYSIATEVISMRLHAAIPAASLGAAVSMIALDTRGQACDAFGIPWAHYTEQPPTPMHAVAPEYSPVQQLRDIIL